MLARLTMIILTFGGLVACGSPDPAPPTQTASPTRAAVSWDQMQGRWWSWAATEPEDTNPVADATGKFCDRNQPDDIWFLAGTFGGKAQRRCSVPADRLIVVPLL